MKHDSHLVSPFAALGLRLQWKASLPATRDDSGATP
jgi:hypothetical protein